MIEQDRHVADRDSNTLPQNEEVNTKKTIVIVDSKATTQQSSLLSDNTRDTTANTLVNKMKKQDSLKAPVNIRGLME